MKKKTQRLTKKDTKPQRELKKLIAEDPRKTKAEYSRDLKELGVVKSDRYVYEVMKNREDIAEYLAIKRENLELQIVKEGPRAVKLLKKEVKKGNIDAAKVIIKHALPPKQEPFNTQPMIHIDQIAIQQHIHSYMTNKDKDTIDVSSS